MSSLAAPSPWFEAHVESVRSTAARGPALDLACGRGRHARALARMGHPVVGVDRNADALAELNRTGGVACVRADLESGTGLPFAPAQFGAVLVFRYLHRTLAPALAAALTPGGVLLYETFTTAQRDQGWGPRRGDFLLEPGELPTLFPTLEILAHEEGLDRANPPAAQASLWARKPA